MSTHTNRKRCVTALVALASFVGLAGSAHAVDAQAATTSAFADWTAASASPTQRPEPCAAFRCACPDLRCRPASSTPRSPATPRRRTSRPH